MPRMLPSAGSAQLVLGRAMSTSEHTFELITASRHDPVLLDAQWNTDANGGQPSAFMLLRLHHSRFLDAVAIHSWSDVSLAWEHFERECTRAVESYDGPGKGGPLKARLIMFPINRLVVSDLFSCATNTRSDHPSPAPGRSPFQSHLQPPSRTIPSSPLKSRILSTLYHRLSDLHRLLHSISTPNPRLPLSSPAQRPRYAHPTPLHAPDSPYPPSEVTQTYYYGPNVHLRLRVELRVVWSLRPRCATSLSSEAGNGSRLRRAQAVSLES